MNCEYCGRELPKDHYIGNRYNINSHFCDEKCEEMAVLRRSCDATGESMYSVLKRRRELGL